MAAPARGRLGCRAIAAILSLLSLGLLLVVAVVDPELAGRLVSEDNPVEWLQVAFAVGSGVLAFAHGRAARRAGQTATLDVAIVAAMALICIGEIDLDRVLFGTQIISTRFFVSPRYALAARAAAALVVVGAPLAAAAWLLAHWRHLWGAIVNALHQPWGQVAAFGMALMLAVEVVERPLSSIKLLPRNFAEEVLEFVAALCIFVGLAARRRDISKTDNDQTNI
jgi:hypothetical protein